MKEAGYPNGLKVKLRHQGGSGATQDTVVAIQSYLKDVGIEVMLEPLSRAAITELMFKSQVGSNLLMGNQRGGPNELLVSIDETLAPGSVFFKGVSKPAGFDNLLTTALQSEDMKVTMANLYKLEKLAYDYAMFMPLAGNLFIAVQYPYVKDAEWFWASMPYAKFQYAWLDK